LIWRLMNQPVAEKVGSWDGKRKVARSGRRWVSRERARSVEALVRLFDGPLIEATA
jgi:hypothetical protein